MPEARRAGGIQTSSRTHSAMQKIEGHGHLWLGNLYSVSRVDGTGAQARIHAFALKGAGEPATGPESWLYPLDPS